MAANPCLTVTRVAHATVLIDFDGHRVLTDPWFSEKFGYHHGEPYGIKLKDLPRLDAVIVSHGHYDHYDMKAFARYPDKAVPMLVPRGIAAAARRAGFTRVREVDPWETVALGAITTLVVPGKHIVPEVTYVMEGCWRYVYFAGDTQLIPELRSIAARYPRIDLALLPTNGLRIRPAFNRKIVMDAHDAAELCAALGARYAVPIHYAFKAGALMRTLMLSYSRRAERFEAEAAVLAPQTRVRILRPGESLTID
jgi:L-ascorbate metabolism protein UlaG (beta-lactamase superfamily)